MTRTIMIRRHSFTKKGAARGKGSHLSAEGVAQARRVRESMPTFDLVLTSEIPRTVETALALGYAVDDQIAGLGEIPLAVWDEIGHHERWEWEQPFAQFAAIISQGGATADLGTLQRQLWTQALESVPENGRVLIISHGRVIESGLVTCFPDADFAQWGAPFQHLEGVRMHYHGGAFSKLEFLRHEKHIFAHYPDYYDYHVLREDSFTSLTESQLLALLHHKFRNPVHQATGLSNLIESELTPHLSPNQQQLFKNLDNAIANTYISWTILDNWIQSNWQPASPKKTDD